VGEMEFRYFWPTPGKTFLATPGKNPSDAHARQ